MLLSHQYGPDSLTLKNSFQLELFFDLTSICTWWWNNISKSLKWIIYRSKHKTKIFCITSITRLFELEKRILVAYLLSQSEGKKQVDLPLRRPTQLIFPSSRNLGAVPTQILPSPRRYHQSPHFCCQDLRSWGVWTLLHENIVDRLKIKLDQNWSAGLTPI